MTERIENNQEELVKDAVQQFVDAQLEGQEHDMDEYVKKFPNLESQIRQMILVTVHGYFDSIGQHTRHQIPNLQS